MKVKTYEIKEVTRNIMFSPDREMFIEVPNEPQESYINVENPLESALEFVAYYIPYNWYDVVTGDLVDAAESLMINLEFALLHADRKERKAFAEKFNWLHFSELENGCLHDIFNNGVAEIGEFTDGEGLATIKPLIEKYTNIKLWAVSVYTHSCSNFRLANNFTDNTFLLTENAVDKERMKLLLNYYTDYFNGHIYEFTAYDDLESALNDDGYYIPVYSTDLKEFQENLTDPNDD